MSKITLIIKREYLTRVKKKSFIIMTIIGPILMAALMIVPAWVSQLEDQDNKTIAIIDILAIAAGYILRVYAGEFASGFHLSVWLLLTTISISLSFG